ncbi:hypothetical protein [Scytonema sp. PCC 10023]
MNLTRCSSRFQPDLCIDWGRTPFRDWGLFTGKDVLTKSGRSLNPCP